ncbi:uncharacterized protein LOC142322349 [Lycorma delicatula]|uniref:uncharacterized protein LOC142322349 n=1 Tax=Lycorma delicatula TaxID=130591 RepID=UPI003F514D3F
MWKIKLINKSEEFSEPEKESISEPEEECNLNSMKSDKVDDQKEDMNSSFKKKLKQARLPFQILSHKSPSIQKISDKEKSTVKKRKLVGDSSLGNSKSKLCKRDIKENVCKPKIDIEVLTIEDSVESINASSVNSDVIKDVDDNVNVIEDEKLKNTEEKKCVQKRLLQSEDDKIDFDEVDGDNRKKKCKIGSNVGGDSNTAIIIDNSNNKNISDVDINKEKCESSDKEVGKNSSSSSQKDSCDKEMIDEKKKIFGKETTIINIEESSVALSNDDENSIELSDTEEEDVNENEIKASVVEDEETEKVNKNNDLMTTSKSKEINKKISPKQAVSSDSQINVDIKNNEVENLDTSDEVVDKHSTPDVEISSDSDILDENAIENQSSSVSKTDNKCETPKSVRSRLTCRRILKRKASEKKCEKEKQKQNVINNEDESPNQSSSVSVSDGESETPKNVTKRHLTPKQILKQKESDKKREERKKKQQLKENLKKEKEEKLNRMKEERKRLKLEKEEMKKREKEEKEKKKQIELELKNEEKKAKDEEKRKREEAKEEERRKRDEAKVEEKKKKEAEKRKEEKAASAFASFFTPKRTENKLIQPATAEDVTDSPVVFKKFMPFEVKADMRLATIQRRILDKENKTTFENVLRDQTSNFDGLYIEKLKSNLHVPLYNSKTWPLPDDTDDDVIVIESEVVENNYKEGKKSNCEKKRLQRPRAKLLQFHENRRPPYWGTWRKKSSVIGPRTPFGKDNAIFEYEIYSDDEWEEEEPGESLTGSEDEKESEDEYEVDNKVFVPHGYLSDEEGRDEIEDMSPEAQKAKLLLLEREFEAEMKEKTEKLKPRLIGCVWFNNSIEDPKSVGSHIAELLLSRRAVLWDNEALPIEVEKSGSITSSPVNTPAKNEQNKVIKTNIFPESAIPQLIKLVHGNRLKHKFLVEEFYNYLIQNTKSSTEIISKNAISNKKREIAEWTVYPQEENSNHPMIGQRCWFVSKEIRQKYCTSDQNYNENDSWMYILEIPRWHQNNSIITPSSEQVSPVTPITKFTKVLSKEERQKQLTHRSKNVNTCLNKKQLQTTPSSSSKDMVPACNSSSKKIARRSFLDDFVKLKGDDKRRKSSESNVSEIIVLSSPEKDVEDSHRITNKTDPKSVSFNGNLGCEIKSFRTGNDREKLSFAVSKTTPVKPIKRITPICISPLKHLKKVDDKQKTIV